MLTVCWYFEWPAVALPNGSLQRIFRRGWLVCTKSWFYYYLYSNDLMPEKGNDGIRGNSNENQQQRGMFGTVAVVNFCHPFTSTNIDILGKRNLIGHA